MHKLERYVDELVALFVQEISKPITFDYTHARIVSRDAMNVLLWVLHALLAALFAMAGSAKIFMFENIAHGAASNQALSRGAWMGVGVFEVLCALALIIPAATGIFSLLTPIAAACLALEGIAVAGLHYSYAEHSPLVFNLILAGLAGFVSYGRFAGR